MADQQEALHTVYRPRKLSEVAGQSGALKALETLIAKGGSQQFIFSGPAGVGKTTCARIVAAELGCAVPLTEIDAATNNGVDAMRALQDGLQYMPLSGGAKRGVLIDECHRLSAQAWDSLLKSVEEPPPHVVWLFCTTNIAKVPKTILTRCTHLQLKALSDKDLGDLLKEVCELEAIEIPDDVADLAVKEAKGSARQLLTNLALIRETDNKKDAAEILKTALETDVTIELCRFLAKGGSWATAMALVKQLEGENFEGVRILVSNYFASVARSARSEKDAAHALRIMDMFSVPFNEAEKDSPLIMAIGRVLLSE